MSYKVELPVLTSGSNELPDELKQFVDANNITYTIGDAGSDRSIVTFESQGRDQLQSMIEQVYAPSKESEWSQFTSQITAEGVDAGQESYLTQSSREVPPHVDDDVEPQPEADFLEQEDEVEAEPQSDEPVDEPISSQTIASDVERDDAKPEQK